MLTDRLESPQMTSERQTPVEFEVLFESTWPRVYAFLARMLGDPDEAEDLALESFLRLHERPALLAEGQNPTGWLFKVAANLGYNALRARRRRRWYERLAGKLDLPVQQPADPARAVELSIESQQVREILAEMRPRGAKILLLRHAGLRYREIAEAVGVAPGSVGTLLSRAEKEFARRYRGRFGAPDFA